MTPIAPILLVASLATPLEIDEYRSLLATLLPAGWRVAPDGASALVVARDKVVTWVHSGEYSRPAESRSETYSSQYSIRLEFVEPMSRDDYVRELDAWLETAPPPSPLASLTTRPTPSPVPELFTNRSGVRLTTSSPVPPEPFFVAQDFVVVPESVRIECEDVAHRVRAQFLDAPPGCARGVDRLKRSDGFMVRLMVRPWVAEWVFRFYPKREEPFFGENCPQTITADALVRDRFVDALSRTGVLDSARDVTHEVGRLAKRAGTGVRISVSGGNARWHLAYVLDIPSTAEAIATLARLEAELGGEIAAEIAKLRADLERPREKRN